MNKLDKYIEKLEKLVELEDRAINDMIQLREEMEMFKEDDENKDCE